MRRVYQSYGGMQVRVGTEVDNTQLVVNYLKLSAHMIQATRTLQRAIVETPSADYRGCSPCREAKLAMLEALEHLRQGNPAVSEEEL